MLDAEHGQAFGAQVTAGAHYSAQCFGLRRIRGGQTQTVVPQPPVLGDDLGVTSIGFGPGQYFAITPNLDRIRLDRHHRVPGLKQRIHQPPVPGPRRVPTRSFNDPAGRMLA